MHPLPGVTWTWSRFALGLCYAFPALVAAPFSPTVSLALALGVIPAAAFGVPPRKRGRTSILVIGTLTAAGIILGSTLTQVPTIAIVSIFALSVGTSLWSIHGRLGQLSLAVVLPIVGIGLSFADPKIAGVTAILMAAGSCYAWGVSLLWPNRDDPPLAPPPSLRGSAMLVYGTLLGCASALAAMIGYLLHLEHVGWATAAALLVMRPVRGQVVMRSVGRAVSVVFGALCAALISVLNADGIFASVLACLAIAALCATQGSRWYVAPAFTTFVALTLILRTATGSPAERFTERSIETFVGIGAALLFGAIIPAAISASRHWRANSHSYAPQVPRRATHLGAAGSPGSRQPH